MSIPITPTREQVQIWKTYNSLDVEKCKHKRIKHIQRVVHTLGTTASGYYGQGTVWDIWECSECDYQSLSTPGNVTLSPGWKSIAESMTPLRVSHPTRRKRLHGLQLELRHKQRELAELKTRIAIERAK